LILSNLPSDLELYEGADKLAMGGRSQPLYEPLGTHTYRYLPADRFKPEEVATNIVEGLNFLLRPRSKVS